MKVGVVGLGRMGGAMVAHLIKAGHDVSLYDPVTSLVEAIAKTGGRACGSLAEVCEGREVVLTVLPTDAIFESVTSGPGGLVENLAPGAIHMVSGTHGLPLTEKLAALHEAKGQILLTANLLGRPERAASAELGFILGGPKDAADKVMPLVEVMGSSCVYAGDTPGAAVVCKLANSFVLGCSIEAFGEAAALVRKYGVEADILYRVLTEGLFNCVAYKAYGTVISKEDWENVGATVTIGLKDTELALEAGRARDVLMPSGDVYRANLIACRNKGEANLDWSVMAREQFRRSGLE